MRRLLPIVICQLLLATVTVTTHAQVEGSTPEQDLMQSVIRVEEDWVALIRNPDPETTAPQIVNLISPDGSSDANFGLVEINHGSGSEFVSGGLQIQSWKNDNLMQKTNSISGKTLSRGYDRFEYTIGMELVDGELKYQIKGGKSKTWGNFTRDKNLFASTPTSLTSLEKYNRQYSVDNTLVNVGAHRVESLYQRRVRLYAAGNQLVREDKDILVIHRFARIVTDDLLNMWETNPDYFNVEITQ